MSLQPIDVDFEVFQKIQLARRGFDDTNNAALRRLLGFEAELTAPSEISNSKAKPVEGWASKGVQLPNGAKLRMTYKGKSFFGEVQSNRWHVLEQNFSSPSDAACAVAKVINGKHTSLNGWIYWQAQLPGSADWTSINTLRSDGSD